MRQQNHWYGERSSWKLKWEKRTYISQCYCPKKEKSITAWVGNRFNEGIHFHMYTIKEEKKRLLILTRLWTSYADYIYYFSSSSTSNCLLKIILLHHEKNYPHSFDIEAQLFEIRISFIKEEFLCFSVKDDDE